VNRDRRAREALALAGAGLILGAGLIHLVLTPEHLKEAPYLGLLFLADFLVAATAAFGILRGRRWGWALGALVAGGAYALYFVNGTVGLPGVEEGHLIEAVGLFAKTVEALFLVLCAFALARGLAPRGRWAVLAATVAALVVLPAAALALAPGDAEEGSTQGNSHHGKQEGAEQTEPAPEPTTPTGASGGVSAEEQAAQSEADCRLVIYIAEENMTRQKANAFAELLADMIRTMEDPSWTVSSLRNTALDHLGVPRYPECKVRGE
jgi:roadblock/LC7 domain-containing protein